MNDRAGSGTTEPAEQLLAQRFGQHLRSLREKSQLSTRALAAKAGISQPYLSQLERGLSSPSMVTTYRLAEALSVLPGALFPSPAAQLVTVVRAGEGRQLPVATRPDAAVGRALLMDADNDLEVIEYDITPGEYLEEWFELDGDLAMYLVSGGLDVEIEGAGSYRLGPRDLLAHPASLRHRWLLVDGQPAHVVLIIAHPPQAGPRR